MQSESQLQEFDMKKKIIDRINDVLPELHAKEKMDEEAEVYASIARQLEFLKQCYEKELDYKSELNDRKLNFGIVASRNLAGPEEELEKKISEINALLIQQNKTT